MQITEKFIIAKFMEFVTRDRQFHKSFNLDQCFREDVLDLDLHEVFEFDDLDKIELFIEIENDINSAEPRIVLGLIDNIAIEDGDITTLRQILEFINSKLK